jgi:hypothetical protein
VSSAPSRRNIEESLQSSSYSDEPVVQLESGAADSGFLRQEGLDESFSNIIIQKLDTPQSCLTEVPRKIYPPASLDTCRGWAEVISDGGKLVLDQAATREIFQPIDFTGIDDMMAGDGISDDWIDAFLEEDISLQDNSTGQSAEDTDMTV